MDRILEFLSEMIVQQQKQLRKIAEQVIPNITEEDLLQPSDFEKLEHNSIFRYEEGVLHGMLSVQSALFAKIKENS